MLRRKFAKFTSMLLIILLSGLVTAGVALADQVKADAIVATAFSQDRWVEITSEPGQTWDAVVGVYINDVGQQTTFPVLGSITSDNAAASLSKTEFSINDYSSVDTVTVSGTAPNIINVYEYKVTFTVTNNAPNLGGNPPSDWAGIRLNVTEPSTPADTTAPTGSITINSNATYTNNTNVTLNLSATDNIGVTGYRVADGTDASGGNVVPVVPGVTPFSTDIAYTLPTGDGTKTVAVQYRDESGNWSQNYTDSIILDQTDPTLAWGTPNPAPNAAGWNNTPVSISYTTDDNLSGVASAIPISPLVFGTEGEAQIKNVTVTDNAGNSATFTSPAVSIDWTAPTVEFGSPQDSVYILNSTASVSWTASDNISGLATPTSGSLNLDTSSVGSKYVEVTATDNAGNTQTYRFNYKIEYNFGGILQPINSDGSSVFKAGSTVPVKFQLTDANGAFVSNAVATIKYAKLSNEVFAEDVEAISTSAATTGSNFRYDTTANQYIFNLSTKGLTAGTYRLTITLNDGTTQTVQIGLK